MGLNRQAQHTRDDLKIGFKSSAAESEEDESSADYRLALLLCCSLPGGE